MLGLPDTIRACLFDLDGVLTRTALVHAAAWKEMFDGFLRERAARTGEPFVEFDPLQDYRAYVDGMPRADGVRTFLASRGIVLPEGEPEDAPGAETVNGLGNRKNELVLERIVTSGVEVYEGSVRYLHAAREAGLARAVVSASANTVAVLQSVGLEDLFDVRVDGVVALERGLRGKPAPDTFLLAAEQLGVEPPAAAVFEDALAGVEAGKAGGFGFVVGVDRTGHAEELRDRGADVVVSDLAELLEHR
ncbi:MAG: beta-phosphoglucomutase family hydrolase [Actinobacteria bacterium]|nr:beta-phosphoglucomutase family hydrolase [Actinomycetota bacterium]